MDKTTNTTERNPQAQNQNTERKLEMIINSLEVGAITSEGYYPIFLRTSRGTVEGRYYAAADRRRSVVFAGSEKGGWDTPVNDMLYPGLSNYLARKGINCLRIKYRYPTHLSESILDILAGITFLQHDGAESVGLVGHSFGGAAVIQAAASSPLISTVVSLAPQLFGTDAVESFKDSQSLLLIHGTDDESLSQEETTSIYEYAHEPKKVIFYKGARHNLDEAAPEVFRTVRDWIETHI